MDLTDRVRLFAGSFFLIRDRVFSITEYRVVPYPKRLLPLSTHLQLPDFVVLYEWPNLGNLRVSTQGQRPMRVRDFGLGSGH
jgi:hypothetical protein